MRNVEGVREVRLVENPEEHYAHSLEQEHKIIKQAAVGVLSLRRAPKLGKLLVCLALDLLFVQSLPPAEPKGARSAGPIGVRGSVSPTIYFGCSNYKTQS